MQHAVIQADFLGTHILAEFWGCNRVDDPDHIETVMVEAARASGATVLRSNMHHFGEGMGVTGVVLLAESHLSIHSWPEYGYAAVDVFVCGNANPHRAIESLKCAFQPTDTYITEHKRGGRLNG